MILFKKNNKIKKMIKKKKKKKFEIFQTNLFFIILTLYNFV
jgi:hypothetical protein